jgi:hypothetical protein
MTKLIIIVSMAVLTACCFKGVKKEVSLDVSMPPVQDGYVFQKVVADGGAKPIELKMMEYDNLSYMVFALPVNSNADSTRYFFFSEGRTDTVVIQYQRVFNEEKCGLTMDFTNEKVSKNTLSNFARLSLGKIGTWPGNFSNQLDFYN